MHLIPALFLTVILFACGEPPPEEQPIAQEETALQKAYTLHQDLPSQVGPEARQAFEQGLAYQRLQLQADAEMAFQQALELDPTVPQFHYRLGLTAQAQGHYQDAETAFLKALELSDEYLAPRITLGKMLYAVKGDVEQATQLLEEAMALDPNILEASYALALIKESEGEPEKALGLYTRIAATNPAFQQVQTKLGVAYLQTGNLEQATQTLNKAIRLTPYDPAPFLGLARTLTRQGKIEEGKKYNNRARQLQDQEEALRPYLTSLQQNPGRPQPHYNVGVMLVRFGRYASAENHYLQAIELDSSYALSFQGMGTLYLLQGELEQAADSFQRALSRDTTLADSHNKLGLIHHQKKDVAQAVEHYRAAVRFAPRTPGYYANLGNAYRDLNNVEQARINAEKALELDPESLAASELMADVQALGGDLKGAIERWEKISASTPGNKKLKVKLQRARKMLEEDSQ